MKTGAPVKLAPRKEIVPLNAVARATKTAEQRLPALADVAPGFDFSEGSGRLARGVFLTVAHACENSWPVPKGYSQRKTMNLENFCLPSMLKE
jgi:hypothetical protein